MPKLNDWQQANYAQLVNGFNQINYHAIILYPSIMPMNDDAIGWVATQYLLCLNPRDNLSCGNCQSCNLFIEQTHPDLFILQADIELSKSLTIKVEQVRQLIEFTSRTSHTAKNKVIFIPNISELVASVNSANSLLKVLEEPPENCYFIINASDISKILPTILSRASKLKLDKPPYEYAIAQLSGKIDNPDFWLTYYDNELVYDVAFNQEEFIQLIEVLCLPSLNGIFMLLKNIDSKAKYKNILEFILKWLQDCMLYLMTNQAYYFKNYIDKAKNIIAKLNKDKLYNLQQDIIFLLEWVNHPLSHKLQLENIFIKYQQLYV